MWSICEGLLRASSCRALHRLYSSSNSTGVDKGLRFWRVCNNVDVLTRNMRVCLAVCPSVCLCFCRALCLYVSLSLCLCVSVCVSLSVSFRPPVCLSVCLHVCRDRWCGWCLYGWLWICIYACEIQDGVKKRERERGRERRVRDFCVRVHACVFMQLCIHVHPFVYSFCMCIHMHTFCFQKLSAMHVLLHAFMHVCMHACMHACMHWCMYVCTYVCMDGCMYVCVVIYIYTYQQLLLSISTSCGILVRGN